MIKAAATARGEFVNSTSRHEITNGFEKTWLGYPLPAKYKTLDAMSSCFRFQFLSAACGQKFGTDNSTAIVETSAGNYNPAVLLPCRASQPVAPWSERAIRNAPGVRTPQLRPARRSRRYRRWLAPTGLADPRRRRLRHPDGPVPERHGQLQWHGSHRRSTRLDGRHVPGAGRRPETGPGDAPRHRPGDRWRATGEHQEPGNRLHRLGADRARDHRRSAQGRVAGPVPCRAGHGRGADPGRRRGLPVEPLLRHPHAPRTCPSRP